MDINPHERVKLPVPFYLANNNDDCLQANISQTCWRWCRPRRVVDQAASQLVDSASAQPVWPRTTLTMHNHHQRRTTSDIMLPFLVTQTNSIFPQYWLQKLIYASLFLRKSVSAVSSLITAYPGCPGSKNVKRSLLLLLLSIKWGDS